MHIHQRVTFTVLLNIVTICESLHLSQILLHLGSGRYFYKQKSWGVGNVRLLIFIDDKPESHYVLLWFQTYLTPLTTIDGHILMLTCYYQGICSWQWQIQQNGILNQNLADFRFLKLQITLEQELHFGNPYTPCTNTTHVN